MYKWRVSTCTHSSFYPCYGRTHQNIQDEWNMGLKGVFKDYLIHIIELVNKCIYVAGKENHICHISDGHSMWVIKKLPCNLGQDGGLPSPSLREVTGCIEWRTLFFSKERFWNNLIHWTSICSSTMRFNR